jgi:hypothetical protein
MSSFILFSFFNFLPTNVHFTLSKTETFCRSLTQVTQRPVISSKHPGRHILSRDTERSWQLGGGKIYWQQIFKFSSLPKVQKHIINWLPDTIVFWSAGPFYWQQEGQFFWTNILTKEPNTFHFWISVICRYPEDN